MPVSQSVSQSVNPHQVIRCCNHLSLFIVCDNTLYCYEPQLVVRTDRYTFYRIPVDSRAKGKLVVAVSPVDEHGHGDITRGKENDNTGDERD
jgi:hypothetical protein